MASTLTGMQAVSEERFERLPPRIRNMSDANLLRCGRSAAYMASPAASYGPVRATFISATRGTAGGVAAPQGGHNSPH